MLRLGLATLYTVPPNVMHVEVFQAAQDEARAARRGMWGVAGTLAGYAVEDQSGHRYDFPDRVFRKGQTLTLRTGSGTDTQTDLYWNMSTSAVWNNDGDTVKVLDPDGHVVLSREY